MKKNAASILAVVFLSCGLHQCYDGFAKYFSEKSAVRLKAELRATDVLKLKTAFRKRPPVLKVIGFDAPAPGTAQWNAPGEALRFFLFSHVYQPTVFFYSLRSPPSLI